MAGNVKDVSDSTFDAEVLKDALPVLVDFWAPWCGPCRMVAPTVEALSQEYEGKVKFVKVNTDDNPVTAQQYYISSIPSLMLFKDGNVVEQVLGAVPKPKLQDMISNHI